MYKLKYKRNEGITLIALVITIIVLLILAGISITMLTGNNSILNQATNASRENVHANVYEQLQLKVAEYYLGKNSGDVTQGSLIEYLQSGSNPIISEELGEEGSGKYQIYVENLIGTTQKYGKGTASGSDTSTYKDVYMLEKAETTTGSIGNVRVATTKPVRIATSGQIKNYVVRYYGTETGTSNVRIIGNIGDTEGVSLSDLDKLKAYFNRNTKEDLQEYIQLGEPEIWKDNIQIGVKGNDFRYIMYGEESDDGKYFYEYIKYKTKIYKVKGNIDDGKYTDDIVEVPFTGTGGLCKLDNIDVFVTEDGVITSDYELEEDGDETLYLINYQNYYKGDGTLAGFGRFWVEKNHSSNLNNYYTNGKISRAVDDEEFEYTSDDTNIATVDNEGNVTGIEQGFTKIIVKGKTSNKTIFVGVEVIKLQ